MRSTHPVTVIAGCFALLTAVACGDGGVSGGLPGAPTTSDLADPVAETPTEAPKPTTNRDVFYVAEISPAQGRWDERVQVEITGGGFDRGVQVVFGKVPSDDVLVLHEGLIVAAAPVHPPGTVDVTVIAAEGGAEATLQDAFRFELPVRITAVDPPTGHVLGGEPVTVHGEGFERTGTRVVFGTQLAHGVEVLDANTLLAVTPDGVAGPVDVVVSAAAGTDRLEGGYVYTAAQRLDRVVPPAALVDGGDVAFELEGEGFTAPLEVRIGGRRAREVQVDGGSRVTGVVTAPTSAGVVDVEIASVAGTLVAPGAFVWLSRQPGGDEVLAVYPASGDVAGGDRVTLVVSRLAQGTPSVSFGSRAALVVDIDAASRSLLVETPRAAEGGAVDVSVGAATLDDGYRYEPRVVIEDVSPAAGPSVGGTRISLRGRGFGPGTAVRVGGLPATEVRVVDGTTVEATTPPGNPGLANIAATSAGDGATLSGAFAYQGDLAAWLVAPPLGSVRGGSIVDIYGSGFPKDVSVRFGEQAAVAVERVSPSMLRVRTPGGDPGSVAVTIDAGELGVVEAPGGFGYYVPTSAAGGTWGPRIRHNVYVSVLDGMTRAPIQEATVALGTGPDAVTAETDASGMVTFAQPELAGPLMVTATKPGFDRGSIVGFDATNATLVLINPSQGVAFVNELPRGHLFGNVQVTDKYLPVPVASCEDAPETGDLVCAACLSDADCDGMTCSTVPGHGSYCTRDCDLANGCPSGFVCQPVPDEVALQCLPSAGEIKTYCDIANQSETGFDWVPSPGIEPDADGAFELLTPTGEFAAFCWTGLRHNGTFTPWLLGVARGLSANADGAAVVADIRMSHRVDHVVPVLLDRPQIGGDGADLQTVSAYLDLGPDGIIDFPPTPEVAGDGAIRVRLVRDPTGDLHGTTYSFIAGVRSFAQPSARSFTWQRGIGDVTPDTALRRGSEGWESVATGVEASLYDAVEAAGGVLAVGDDGLIITTLGGSWARQSADTKETLRAVDARGDDRVAVGDDGTIVTWNGVVWTAEQVPAAVDFEDVRLDAEGGAWAVGGRELWRRDGGAWAVVGVAPVPLHAVDVAGNVYGDEGYSARWDGGWIEDVAPTGEALRSGLVAADGTRLAVGDGGVALRWEEDGWNALETPAAHDLRVVRQLGDEIYAAGSRGALLRLAGDRWVDQSRASHKATIHALAGHALAGDVQALWALGGHELVLGPMLAVPEGMGPSTLAADRTIRWRTKPGAAADMAMLVLTQGFFTDWVFFLGSDVEALTIPGPQLMGGNPPARGYKGMTLYRVLSPDMLSVDRFDYSNLRPSQWLSWSVWSGTLEMP